MSRREVWGGPGSRRPRSPIDGATRTDELRALEKVDPDMAVNIEHEDHELDQLDGLRYAAQTLLEAAAVTA